MNPFGTSRTEQEVFSDLETLCKSPGYIHVLAYLSLRDNLIAYDGYMTGEHMAASYAPGRTIRTEFSTLMGLMLRHPLDFSIPAPPDVQTLIDRTKLLLDELHACLNKPMLEGLKEAFAAHEAGVSPDETGSFFSRGEVLREPIFYGGESAYSFQYRELAIERYTADDDWLYANKGFRIAEAYAVTEAVARIQNRKVMETIKAMRRLHPSQWSVLPGFTSSLDEIALDAGVSPSITSAVLAAFTSPEPPTNANFVSLGDFNLANALPILRSPSDEYISLQTYALTEGLYESPFYWMAADKSYKDTAFAHRGAFTETFVARRLSSVFGEECVHRNVTISSGGRAIGEIDVLILFADRAMVIQCKSKKLTLGARKGNDLQLRDDFKKSVQDAYDQAHSCGKLLDNAKLDFIGTDGIKVNIPKLLEIYPVCVVSDHYPALTVQAREFLKYETSETIQAPLVADVFLVDVLAEMLPSPLRLLSYINRRVTYGQRINSINELTILAYHLQQNLWIDDKYDMVMLGDEIATDLDTVMTVRREGIEGQRTLDSIFTRLEGTVVGRMLRMIEHCPEPPLVDLGFMLLTLAGETLDDLNRGLDEISARAREDGQDHDFTLAFGEGDTGLTVHCGSLPNAIAAERLAAHCKRRKYVQRAKNWFGLVVRSDDGLPKFGMHLRFAWKQDDEMDRATRGMARNTIMRRGKNMFKPHKIGRNEPCPCGSGKKFKRCCMTV